MNYTDEDEDAERLLSFLDEVCTKPSRHLCSRSLMISVWLAVVQADEAPGPDGKLRKDVKRSSDEDWVETHVNRSK